VCKPTKQFFISLVFIIFLDQMSKVIAGKVVPIVVNCGFSFSLFCTPIAALVNTLVVIVILLILLRYRSLGALEGIFIGSGLSNLMDRIIFGGVRDWIAFGGLLNNLADWAVVLSGIAFFVVQSLHGRKD